MFGQRPLVLGLVLGLGLHGVSPFPAEGDTQGLQAVLGAEAEQPSTPEVVASPRGQLTQLRMRTPDSLLHFTNNTYEPLLFGGRRNFHVLMLWSTPQSHVHCRLCEPLQKELAALAAVHTKLRAAGVRLRGRARHGADARSNQAERSKVAEVLGSIGTKDLFFGIVELGQASENEELFRSRMLTTVPVLELFKATSNTSKPTGEPIRYPIAQYGIEGRAIASFLAANTEYGINLVANTPVVGMRSIGTPDWWDVWAMGMLDRLKLLCGAALLGRTLYALRRHMDLVALLGAGVLCWGIMAGRMYFAIYGESAALLFRDDYGYIMSAENFIMAGCFVFVTWGADVVAVEMPRWRCLRGLSKEGVQLLVGRLLFALLVSASLYIFYSHLMYAQQWAQFHRWSGYPVGAGYGESILNARVNFMLQCHRFVNAVRGVTDVHMQSIHPNFKWLMNTVWFWNGWNDVTFSADGHFSAPTDDCIANPSGCRWSADENQVYIHWGDAGLHTVVPSRVLAAPGTLLKGQRFDGDKCQATFVRLL